MSPSLMNPSMSSGSLAARQGAARQRAGTPSGNKVSNALGIEQIDQSGVLVQPPPDFAARCQGPESANCTARLESLFTATLGDPLPLWTVPTPTVVPPTPRAPAIVEPEVTPALALGSGGGSIPTLTQGGGPTLADCMAIWDPAVHMSKSLWKNVCTRTTNGVDEPMLALGGSPEPKQTKQLAADSAHHGTHVAANHVTRHTSRQTAHKTTHPTRVAGAVGN